MKRNYFIKHILLACSVLVLFSACRKVPEGDMSNEDPNAGTSYIGFPTGMEKSNFFDPFTNTKRVSVFTIKKDAANNSDLQKSQNIVVKALPDAITAYNEANEKEYELLPQDFYTVSTSYSGVSQASNGDLTFAFAGGDFQKEFVINLNGSKLDLSKTYALAYQISSTDGLSVHAASKDTMYVFFSVKNKWDGVYSATGTMTDLKNDAYSHINNWLSVYGISDNGSETNGPMEYELRTVSATQCVLFDNYVFGTVATPFTTGTGADNVSYYGSFGLLITFDPATNKIANVTNYYGQPATNKRYAQLDASGENAYDPSTKSIKIKYDLVGGALVGDNEVRAKWDETWTYIKARE